MHELKDADGRGNEHVDEDNEGGANISRDQNKQSPNKHEFCHIPWDEAAAKISSSSTTADPSRMTSEGACTAKAARAVARPDMFDK